MQERRARRDRPHEFDHVVARLSWLRNMGFQPRSICDIGASDGRWTIDCLTVFPSARYLCVEPLAESRDALDALARANPNVSIYTGCLGARCGEAVLNAAGFASSILPNWDGRSFGTPHRAEMTTLENLVERGSCLPPDLLKIEVQGYELEVLQGAERLLDSVPVIVAEVAYVPLHKGMPVFHEVVDYLARRGFALADVLSISTRPLDGMAAQSDVLFMQHSYPLRAIPAWEFHPDAAPRE